jgi:hypothetical protein
VSMAGQPVDEGLGLMATGVIVGLMAFLPLN